MYVCLYGHHILHISREGINRARLPILLVVSRNGEIKNELFLKIQKA